MFVITIPRRRPQLEHPMTSLPWHFSDTWGYVMKLIIRSNLNVYPWNSTRLALFENVRIQSRTMQTIHLTLCYPFICLWWCCHRNFQFPNLLCACRHSQRRDVPIFNKSMKTHISHAWFSLRRHSWNFDTEIIFLASSFSVDRPGSCSSSIALSVFDIFLFYLTRKTCWRYLTPPAWKENPCGFFGAFK